ncbi:hypothetical protein OC842_001085 [Tilletia horrida]|uniref:Uncharacterized protein n=1 Tax=Tilletia horrida TaxID=155126 RepID=A0AAN6GH31_9BASI|nr:hypothetical protein OC842_001085 [Tilletia horrida]
MPRPSPSSATRFAVHKSATQSLACYVSEWLAPQQQRIDRLLPASHTRGYGTEAAQALLHERNELPPLVLTLRVGARAPRSSKITFLHASTLAASAMLRTIVAFLQAHAEPLNLSTISVRPAEDKEEDSGSTQLTLTPKPRRLHSLAAAATPLHPNADRIEKSKVSSTHAATDTSVPAVTIELDLVWTTRCRVGADGAIQASSTASLLHAIAQTNAVAAPLQAPLLSALRQTLCKRILQDVKLSIQVRERALLPSTSANELLIEAHLIAIPTFNGVWLDRINAHSLELFGQTAATTQNECRFLSILHALMEAEQAANGFDKVKLKLTDSIPAGALEVAVQVLQSADPNAATSSSASQPSVTAADLTSFPNFVEHGASEVAAGDPMLPLLVVDEDERDEGVVADVEDTVALSPPAQLRSAPSTSAAGFEMDLLSSPPVPSSPLHVHSLGSLSNEFPLLAKRLGQPVIDAEQREPRSICFHSQESDEREESGEKSELEDMDQDCLAGQDLDIFIIDDDEDGDGRLLQALTSAVESGIASSSRTDEAFEQLMSMEHDKELKSGHAVLMSEDEMPSSSSFPRGDGSVESPGLLPIPASDCEGGFFYMSE